MYIHMTYAGVRQFTGFWIDNPHFVALFLAHFVSFKQTFLVCCVLHVRRDFLDNIQWYFLTCYFFLRFWCVCSTRFCELFFIYCILYKERKKKNYLLYVNGNWRKSNFTANILKETQTLCVFKSWHKKKIYVKIEWMYWELMSRSSTDKTISSE